MKKNKFIFIGVLTTLAVLSGGCAREDKVANNIRKATQTVDPYDYNYDFSDMKDATGLGRGNGSGYWNNIPTRNGVQTNRKNTTNPSTMGNDLTQGTKNITNRVKTTTKNTARQITNQLTPSVNSRTRGGMVSPNTVVDSRYQTPYLYGNSRQTDAIINPVVLRD